MSLIPNPNINGLTNPLATNLQANNFEIQAASKVTGTTVETDNIRLVPGSGSTYIDVEDTMRIAGLKALEFSTKPAVGGNIRADSGAGGLHISGLISDVKADVLGYDSTTGQVVVQPAGGSGTLNSVQAGTAITVDNTNPFDPIVNNAGVTALNLATGSLTVAAGTGITVGTVGTTITITNSSPSSGGTLTGVGAGTNISVDNTVPAVPVVAVNISSTLDLNNNDLVDGKDGSFLGALTGATVTSSTGNIQAEVDLVANTGNIVANVGNIQASTGNITALLGDISTVGGDIVSTSGDIGTGSGDIGTLTGNIGAPGGTVSGLALEAGANGITSEGVVNLDPLTGSPQDIVGALNITGSGTAQFGNLLVTDTGNAVGSAGWSLKTDDPLFASQAGTVASVTFPDPTAQNAVAFFRGALSIEDPPNGGLPAQIIVNGVPQTLNGSDWSTYAATTNVDLASFEIQNAGNITSSGTIESADMVATNTILVGADGLDVEATLDFTPTNELFVATNGDDTTGNGSSLQPFATIQKAIDTADAVSPKTGITVIQVANGDYTDPINITGPTSGWIQINGQSTSQNQAFGVVLRGSITINITSGPADRISRQVIFSGLQINSIIYNTSSLEHTVIIQNCRLFPIASTNGASIIDSNTAPGLGNRVLIDNCEYTNDTPSGTPQGPFQFTGNSTISFSKCDIQSPTVSPIILCGGTSYFQRLENCYIESQYNTPTQPLVIISSTATNTHNIALNVFSFTTGTGVVNPAIVTSNGGTIFLVSNNFNLVGTNPTTGNVIAYTGTAPTLIYGNNSAVPLYASGIQTGITLVPVAAVGSQPIKATTISATSGTIASTTMTGNTISTTGTGQGVVCATVSNGATVLNGRVNVTGSASSIAMNVNTGSAATNVIELNGGTYSTNGATNIRITPTTIANAANNTAMTGVNSITMAGTTPAITAVNNIAISNTNATIPLDIVNSGDNPHIRCANAAASTTVPVEINLVNGPLTLAYGNQGTDPRGAFFFFGGKDIIRMQSSLQRVQMSYSPYAPTFATSGAAGAFVAGTAGAFVSGVPKLLGTETITLTASNFPIIPGGFGTPFYVGLNGYLNTAVLNAAHDFVVSVTYTRTRSGVTVGPYALYGAIYPVTSQAGGAFYSPLNGTTYNEAVVGERITFTHNDVLAIQVYGTYTGGSPPNLVTPPTGLAAVFSPFLV